MSIADINVWTISLNDPWFHHVQSGKKIYEGRRYSTTTKKYCVGDILEICNHTNPEIGSFTAQIVEIKTFKVFKEALETLPLQEVLPGVDSIAEGVEIYKKFVSLSTQEREGVCMIKLKR